MQIRSEQYPARFVYNFGCSQYPQDKNYVSNLRPQYACLSITLAVTTNFHVGVASGNVLTKLGNMSLRCPPH